MMQCPGQDSRYWDGSAIFETPCPRCAAEIEFFKDEGTRRCKKCGHKVLNPTIDFGCALYCPYADKCLGSLPPELLKRKQEHVKEYVSLKVKNRLGTDFKKIGTAVRMARHGERISAIDGGEPWDADRGGNPAIIYITSFILGAFHPGDSANPSASNLSPPDADEIKWVRRILEEAGADLNMIDEVQVTWERLARGEANTVNERIVHDAQLTAMLEEGVKEKRTSGGELRDCLPVMLHTPGGRVLANEVMEQHAKNGD